MNEIIMPLMARMEMTAEDRKHHTGDPGTSQRNNRPGSVGKHLQGRFVEFYMKNLTESQRIAISTVGIKTVDPLVLLTATPLMTKLVAHVGKHRSKHGHGRVIRCKINQTPVSVVNAGIGAPSTALTIWGLACAGAQRIIRVEFCGSLSHEIDIGDLFLVDEAVSFEGVTEYYLPGTKTLTPNVELTHRLAEVLDDVKGTSFPHLRYHRGRICTVDVFSTDNNFYRAKAESGQAVDMETSAIFALGRVHRLETCALLLISDAPLAGKTLFGDHYPYEKMLAGLDMLKTCVRQFISGLH